MPKGCETHYGKLRVYFNYNGELCREPLNLSDTRENRRYAEGLVATIKHEIDSGRFNYGLHFPNSAKLAENRLDHWVSLYLDIKKKQVSPATWLGYDRWCRNYILPSFGHRQAEQLDAIHVQQWIADDLCALSSKSIKDIISVLRQIYMLYRMRNQSAANPTDGIKIVLPDDDEPDAFSLDEVNKIVNTATHRPGDLNAVQFAICTGPRPSEWLALGWDDVNLETGEVAFKRSIVLKTYKATKTKRSKRWVDLLPQAKDALAKQYALTGGLKPVKIKVLQRDNRTVKAETFRPVFINDSTARAYEDVKHFNRNFFIKHLVKAEVRHRCVSMCRHTFASTMLSMGTVPINWICDQLGHTSDAMLRRKYAKLFKRQRSFDPVLIAGGAFDLGVDDAKGEIE